ncbi:TIGR03089 family protein [Catenulispora pinisilvae]|uniref:TIGR03089 family protein n=1 Tax=Catenulispora pinisilvae TaxID=2705253 RepID=UPI002B2798CF|nr:TIGR03089 family protein [Catenulispora pinisilvae]
MTAANSSFPGAWRAALALGPSRPFLTYYDDHTGERVELSYTTFDNWVAKTANLIQDDLALGAGDEIAILLPTHWQTPIWLLACWTAGVVASVGEDPAAAERASAVVAGPDRLEEARACKGERIALALRPLGAPFPSVPEGFTDYAALAPAQPDVFAPYSPVTADTPALVADGGSWTQGELVRDAAEAAARWNLSAASRVLTGCAYDSRPEIRAALTSELAVGASLVLCRNVDPSRLPGRMASEKVNARVASLAGGTAGAGGQENGTAEGTLGVLPVE